MRVCVHTIVCVCVCMCEYARNCMWDCEGVCAILSMHELRVCIHESVLVNAPACKCISDYFHTTVTVSAVVDSAKC